MVKKRFLAGVNCPQCHSMDTMQILMYNPNQKDEILCVQCGYTDKRPDKIHDVNVNNSSIYEINRDIIQIIQLKSQS